MNATAWNGNSWNGEFYFSWVSRVLVWLCVGGGGDVCVQSSFLCIQVEILMSQYASCITGSLSFVFRRMWAFYRCNSGVKYQRWVKLLLFSLFLIKGPIVNCLLVLHHTHTSNRICVFSNWLRSTEVLNNFPILTVAYCECVQCVCRFVVVNAIQREFERYRFARDGSQQHLFRVSFGERNNTAFSL